jgi:uncharacterized protein YcbX
MRVTQLWCYPVKSLAGHRLERAHVGELGIDGDRGFGLVDLETGLVLTARRVPELLFAVPIVDAADGAVRIKLPDGTVTGEDAVLSAWLGRRVELRRPARGERGRYEIALNDDRPDREWIRWEGPQNVFHDSKRTRVSIVCEDAFGKWDVRRFRPNVVVAGGDERDLIGHRVRIGDAELEVAKEIDRCVIVTRPQPGLERDKDVLVEVHQQRRGNLGAGALVHAPGTIAVDDPVLLAS